MSTLEAPVPSVVEPGWPKIQWGPVFAGALSAVALSLVLHGFATTIGISVSSSAPTWRDASFALILLSGFYLLLVALISYGFGAYICARARTALRVGSLDDVAFRDGIHGIVVWALATLLTAVTAFAIASLVPRMAAPSGNNGAASSVAGENIIAYDLDRLFRGERRPQDDLSYPRAEAARILMTASSHRGVLPEDHTYLVRLVSAHTGLAAPEAERRVNDVTTRARENINRARASAAILAFAAAAAALVGAAIAWYAAIAGGRHRDGVDVVPELWDWDRPYRRS